MGPADRTGKSSVRYCPGGRSGLAARRRPKNPGETMPMTPTSCVTGSPDRPVRPVPGGRGGPRTGRDANGRDR
ncbi:hypothetical protein GCM10017559_54930 [Streptosporangium longisporum]|uniref:Uncharacterized protein n=1 Tax=Streptosporangium longisporum TaxID=46187 RepID=A0ABN3Y8I9_9ACTN